LGGGGVWAKDELMVNSVTVMSAIDNLMSVLMIVIVC
jgi:hypothetical protein